MNACPQFSIIIPCYNAGAWIRNTIESILNQTYADFEIIAVDDGSQDDTLVQLLSISDPRLIVHHKENGGVSSARNMGLKKAKGKWVTFVDADDTIEPCMLEELQSAITSSPESALFIWGISKDFYLPNGRLVETETRLPSRDLYIPNKELGSYLRYMLTSLDMESTCNKLFRREFVELHEIRFNEQTVIFEDFQFVIDYLTKAMPDITLLKKSWYHYRANVGELNASRRSRYNLVSDIESLVSKLFVLKEGLDVPFDDDNKIITYIMQKINVIFGAIRFRSWRDIKKVFSDIRLSSLTKKQRLFSHCGRKNGIILQMIMKRLYFSAMVVFRIL